MGNLQTLNTQQHDQGNNQVKVLVDFKKPVTLQLKPLFHSSLKQIRDIYAPFRQRKGSPILSRSEFLRFLRLSRIMSFSLFDRMCSKHSLNVFEIVSILALTAYTSYTYKVQFLFNVFDLDSSRGLQFKQLILSFKSLIRGYCILTQQTLPEDEALEKYGRIMFSRADLNNDQCLQLGEVLGWFQSNTEGIDLFKRFQPKDVIAKEQYQIFNSFLPYDQYEIQVIYHRIQKEYEKRPLSQEDFELLNYAKATFKRTQSKSLTQEIVPKRIGHKDQKFKTKTSYVSSINDISKLKRVNFSMDTKKVSGAKSKELFPKFSCKDGTFLEKLNLELNKQNQALNAGQKGLNLTSPKRTSVTFTNRLKNSMLNSRRQQKTPKETNNTLMKGSRTVRNLKNTHQNSWETSLLDLSQVNLIRKKLHKKKFQNIIILRGKTLTKKQIFELRDYFEGLSGGKKVIQIQNFIGSFSQQKYNHMKSVAASLFNFLDMDQNGKVTFRQLIQKLHPDLTAEHYEMIKLWNNEYNQNYNLQKKIKANREHQQLKKRILPKSCITRYQQMFNFFDKGKKGYVDFQDLKRVLSDVSSEKQLIQTFEENDIDKDGKLNLKEFMHVILPVDLQIQGI